MKDIRLVLKEIVRMKGPIRKVAAEVGIDHANLIRMMREGSNPRLKTLERILERLGYRLIITGKEVKSDNSRPSRSRR